ncbi:glucosaminidase domain-containing protein [Pseudidiomarina sp.]|uniref:glucosaminidase domain-containing protein n=1 Tax=Pseudidiomarina sp. TaxID=2081707 RepID=UPI00299F2FA7|nr:glucosaminidase domain-containing protein [Pseudidiomarina sp.]MDX1704983.1 glucosaminidase domain-containing protein [Pseudidiomarina sp.]
MLRVLFFAIVAVAVAAIVWWPVSLDLRTDEQIQADQLTPGPMQMPVITEVPDFSEYTDVREKKEAFFSFLAPLVQAENARIKQERRKLAELSERWSEGLPLSPEQTEWLSQLALRYRAKFDLAENSEMFRVLFRRVDVVPETLVLVQAANESAWGTSRFALDALNFFGQWCFSEGCGLVPESRNEGANHEVRRFNSVNASVRSYLRNINTHPAYLQLRLLREQRRAAASELRAVDLTAGLLSYSERGEEYIEELNAMIRVNRPIIVDVIEATPDSPPE